MTDKLKKIGDLLDEKSEVAGWVVLIYSFVSLPLGWLEQWPGVVTIGLSLVTLLGSQYYKGVRLSKDGLEIS